MQLFVIIKKKNILVKLKIFIHILFSLQEIIIIFFRIKIKKKINLDIFILIPKIFLNINSEKKI